MCYKHLLLSKYCVIFNVLYTYHSYYHVQGLAPGLGWFSGPKCILVEEYENAYVAFNILMHILVAYVVVEKSVLLLKVQ